MSPVAGNVEEDFEEFWLAYPRRIAKKLAFRSYQARRVEGISASDLLRAAKTYATVCQNEGRQPNVIMHPATFCGPHERFLDYLPPEGDAALAWHDFEVKGWWVDNWDHVRYSVSPDERGFAHP